MSNYANKINEKAKRKRHVKVVPCVCKEHYKPPLKLFFSLKVYFLT